MYTVTVYDNPDYDETGRDVVTLDYPIDAIELIQKARVNHQDVTYTGDPWGDFAAMNED